MVFVGLSSTTRRSQGGDSFYGPKKFVGKSLLRVKMSKNAPVASPDSDIYDRWSQALASGIDLATEACELSMKLHSPHVFSAILPVVVVANGSLWTVVYDDKGDMLDEPKTAKSCELYVGHSLRLRQEPKAFSHQFTFSHVHFFTLSGFDSFLDRMVTKTKLGLYYSIPTRGNIDSEQLRTVSTLVSFVLFRSVSLALCNAV